MSELFLFTYAMVFLRVRIFFFYVHILIFILWKCTYSLFFLPVLLVFNQTKLIFRILAKKKKNEIFEVIKCCSMIHNLVRSTNFIHYLLKIIFVFTQCVFYILYIRIF